MTISPTVLLHRFHPIWLRVSARRGRTIGARCCCRVLGCVGRLLLGRVHQRLPIGGQWRVSDIRAHPLRSEARGHAYGYRIRGDQLHGHGCRLCVAGEQWVRDDAGGLLHDHLCARIASGGLLDGFLQLLLVQHGARRDQRQRRAGQLRGRRGVLSHDMPMHNRVTYVHVHVHVLCMCASCFHTACSILPGSIQPSHLPPTGAPLGICRRSASS